MPFWSVLFQRPADQAAADETTEPEFFRDLNLDQLVDAVVAGRDEYDLRPFFHAPLHDVDDVRYRHEIFRDLEREEVVAGVRAFAQAMRDMRKHVDRAAELRHPYQQKAWTLDAIGIYIDAVRRLSAHLGSVELGSRGLRALREHVDAYVRSVAFAGLARETAERAEALARIRYALHVEGDRVTVGFYENEADHATEVLATFERFKRAEAKEHHARFREDPEMDHVEAGILDRVALRSPDVFAVLDAYCARHAGYVDPAIAAFDREVQFYLSYLEHVARLRSSGLAFCYPEVSDRSKEIRASDTFDAALATKLVSGDGRAVVPNDLSLAGVERLLVVTGPNSGGKTTFARTFGQLHHLASLGCLVPGSEARLFLPDALFAHFERAERLGDLRGKLQDDLLRIRQILDRATPSSVVVVNEAFTSTTFRDALFLSARILERIAGLDALCVWVTFIDELASLEKAVSVVAQVSPDDPAVRTYRVLRRPPEGRAYADAIAAKHGLSYARLRERLGR